MPEGHVIHRLARELNGAFGGEPLSVTSPQGRFADEAALLHGRRFAGAEAVGKHLFLRFEPDGCVHIHLGLIGKLRIGAGGVALFSQIADSGTVRLRLDGAHAAAELRGPQWCRLIDEDDFARILAASGPDPLRPDADPERGWARVRASGKGIGALLMDQKVSAGVGNIFRAEVLFRNGVSPSRPGNRMAHRTWQRIWDDLVLLMTDALEKGRIDSVRPEHLPEAMGRPERVDPHGGEVYVYRRAGQPCHVCGRPVAMRIVEGRNLYWCRTCQRR